MAVGGHHLFDGFKRLPLLFARGKGLGQKQGLVFSLVDGLDKRTHPRDRRIKFALTVGFFGIPHFGEELLQLSVGHGGQMAIGIHGQDQEIEQCVILNLWKIGAFGVHTEHSTAD